ncbi:MAG: MATE family efflux transporter [Gemmiger sp.]|nr:MATE family efflux transporter [Gemmiger sp.]
MEKEYLIRTPPARALLTLALPMIIGNLFQQFYNMADSVIVGRFVGEEALAAVGASYSLTNVFISIAIGGGVGASVITAQMFGSRNYTRMRRSVSTALVAFLVLGLVLGGVGLRFSSTFMAWLQTPANVLGDATTYLDIYFLGLPFLFMYNVLSALFNSLGKSRIPLYLLVFSSLFNVALDLYMVRVLGLGVAGVAWATLIAQGVSAVASFVIFLRVLHGYPAKGAGLCFDTKEFGRMNRIALPSILQQSTVSIGMMLVQSVVNSFGSEVLAGYSASMRIESLCIVPMAAIGNAFSSYTAQNLGAGQQGRVARGYHVGYGIVAAIAAGICLVTQACATPLISLFMDTDSSAVALATGTACTRFTGLFYLLIGLKMMTDGLLRGAGDMPMFTVANLVNLGLRVVLAVTLAPRFGIQMVWFAVPIGWLANYLISFAEYRTGKWRTTLHRASA